MFVFFDQDKINMPGDITKTLLKIKTNGYKMMSLLQYICKSAPSWIGISEKTFLCCVPFLRAVLVLSFNSCCLHLPHNLLNQPACVCVVFDVSTLPHTYHRGIPQFTVQQNGQQYNSNPHTCPGLESEGRWGTYHEQK